MNLFNRLLNKNFRLLFKNKIGLVLAGGGALGAYQIGVFQALRELKISDLVKSVSGTSIGALNGTLFLMNDPGVWKAAWDDANFQNFLTREEKKSKKKRRSFEDISSFLKTTWKKLEKDWNTSKSIEDFILKQGINFFSQDGLESVIRDHVDFRQVFNSNVKLYACAYNVDKLEPEYFEINSMQEEESVKALLASSCIPFVYEPVVINGFHYMDGGVPNPLYKKKNIDNTPVTPVFKNNCDIIITVFLDHDETVDYTPFVKNRKDTIILEIYPSQPLETIKGTGSFDFSRATLDERIELGYHDAMFIIAPILVKLLLGRGIDELIQHQNAYNAELRKRFSH